MIRIRIILVILILTGLACGNSSGSSGGGQAPAAKEEPAKAEAAPAAVGQDVMAGAIRWKVLEVKDLGQELKSDNQFVEPKSTSGRFVSVRFEIENTGTEAASFTGVDVVDGKGRTFKPYQDKLFFIPEGEQCVLLQLNPNLAKTCTEIFEVPGDAVGLKMQVGDLSLFGSGSAEIDLGL